MGDKDDVKQNTEIKDTDLLSVRHLAKQSTFDLVFLSLTYKSSFPARYTVTLSWNGSPYTQLLFQCVLQFKTLCIFEALIPFKIGGH